MSVECQFRGNAFKFGLFYKEPGVFPLIYILSLSLEIFMLLDGKLH